MWLTIFLSGVLSWGRASIVNLVVITVMPKYTLHLGSSVVHLCGIKYLLATPGANRTEGSNQKVFLVPIPSNP